MSQLSAAAQALGAPEAIVQRSAEARAKATGASIDDVLTAWAGGAAAAAPAAPAPPAPVAPSPSPRPEPGPGPVASPSVSPPDASPPPGIQQTTTLPGRMVANVTSEPPVLVGRHENPFSVMIGAAAVLLLSIVIGLFAPGQPEAGNGVRTSNIAFSPQALEGKDRYLAENCASCHTQQVRPIAADAGEAEKVTLSDSNQVLGSRRYGPDLANTGGRLDPDTLKAILLGSANHPSYASLDTAELSNLVAYLSESK